MGRTDRTGEVGGRVAGPFRFVRGFVGVKGCRAACLYVDRVSQYNLIQSPTSTPTVASTLTSSLISKIQQATKALPTAHLVTPAAG